MAFPASFIYIITPEKFVGKTKKEKKQPRENSGSCSFIKQKLWLAQI